MCRIYSQFYVHCPWQKQQYAEIRGGVVALLRVSIHFLLINKYEYLTIWAALGFAKLPIQSVIAMNVVNIESFASSSNKNIVRFLLAQQIYG